MTRKLYFDVEIARDFSVPDDIYESAKEKHPQQYNFLPAYNQIIAISVGAFSIKDGSFVTKEIPGNEEQLLRAFFALIEKDDYLLIGYNIAGFDLPFIIHRAMKYNIRIPQKLKIFGVKKWDITWYLDLMEVLKYTGSRFFSLADVCLTLGIQVKQGMDGSMVQEAFDQGRIEEIRSYCTSDVVATKELHEKMIALNLL